MQIPMRVDYAARAIIDLAEHLDAGLVRSADIAMRRSIPEAFLDQVLLELRKAGIIRSLRGPFGGHQLIVQPQELTLAGLFRAMGEEGLTVGCLQGGTCSVTANCVLEDVWHSVGASYAAYLEGVTIADLVQREAERKARDMYYI
jgi:Rrf2 family protein